MIKLYTDGSSTKSRNGWGIIGIYPDSTTVKMAGTEKQSTNQRMELRAALEALKYWKTKSNEEECTLYSDSAYLCNCYYEKWYLNWQNNNWLNSKKEPVANKDLWEQIIFYFSDPCLHIEKVKGHSGHTYNEIADKLATGSLLPDSPQLTIDENYDKINIELSEILLDYSMKKYPVNEIIKRIRKVCNCG